MESLEAEKDDSEKLSNRLQWIGFKDQFFSSVIIAKGDDVFTDANLTSTMLSGERSGGFNYLKHYNIKMVVSFDPSGASTTHLQ